MIISRARISPLPVPRCQCLHCRPCSSPSSQETTFYSIYRYYPFLGSEVWETSSHSCWWCWIPVAGLMAPGSMNYMNNAAPMGAISKAVLYPFLETLRAIVYWICLTRELWSLANSHHSSIKGRCASATATAKRPWCCSHSHCLSRSFKLWRSCLVSNNSRRCRERLSGGALNLLLFWYLLLSELIFEVFLIVMSCVASRGKAICNQAPFPWASFSVRAQWQLYETCSSASLWMGNQNSGLSMAKLVLLWSL